MAQREPWVNYIDGLVQQFEAHRIAQADEDERGDKEFYNILRDACNVVRDAEKSASPELPLVVERAHSLLNSALDWAFADGYYEFIPCFSDSKESPEVEDSLKMCGSDITEAFMTFYTEYLYPGAPRPKLPKFARTTAWTKSHRPHPRSSRLSRFRDGATSPASDDTPLAQLIYQARAEVTVDIGIGEPYAMDLSSGGSILAITRGGGWKRRDPVLHYYLLDQVGDEYMEGKTIDPGLSNVAQYVTTDEERKLVFLADDDRIKSFSWASDAEGKPPKRLTNVHTMNSLRDFSGALALLPNGRLLRAGTGQAAIWTLDALEKHQDSPGQLIGEGKLNTDNSWREAGCPRIEMSSGSRPHDIVAFADDPEYAPTTLHVHAPTGHLLCGEKGAFSHSFGCVAIDVEHGGRRVARYLGHGRDVDRITTSAGDPNVFLTAGSDGFARFFDVRRPLPVLTFNTGRQSEACTDVVFVHPDGIPTMFTGGERTEQIKVWDVRAKSVVYELSTGNNTVTAMAWDSRRNSLFVATECQTRTRMGGLSGYRKARIPRWATWKAAEAEAKALKEGRVPGEPAGGSEGIAAAAPAEPATTTSVDAGVPQEMPADAAQENAQNQAATESKGEVAGEDVEMSQEDDDEEDDEYEDGSDEGGRESGDSDEVDEDDDQSQGNEEPESEEEEPDDIDEEYSASMRWPRSCYHKENFYGYAFDAGRNMLFRWQFKEEPDMAQLPPSTGF